MKLNLLRYAMTGITLLCACTFTATAQTNVSPAEARAIAKEAYIYGYPMVDSYRIQHAYFVDHENPEFKAPWNQIPQHPSCLHAKGRRSSNAELGHALLHARPGPARRTHRAHRAADRKDRYFSVQLIDAYTFNFDYIGTAPPETMAAASSSPAGLEGRDAEGREESHSSETEFVLAVYRTQLFNPGDLDNVKKVQAGYKVQPLSAFLGSAAPPAAPAIDFIKPLTPEQQKTSLEFFNDIEFRPAVLPDESVRDRTDGALRQDRRRRGKDIRREQARARDEDGHRARHG